MAIDKSMDNFRQNLRQDCNDDMTILLIQIVGEKVCGETSLHEIQNNLVVLSTETLFLEKILKFSSQIPFLKNDGMDRYVTKELDKYSKDTPANSSLHFQRC